MPKFRVRFYEEASGYVYFDAEDAQQAQELVDSLEAGDLFEEELPNTYRSTKNGQNEYSDLEEVN
jgi:hypothetical protein